ncbi:hypothetical protein V6N11_056244 [Hibiscus sabdariffa]|uniref:Uncharacterized protein n=1 Tax=Hibiscus sabdariffa TaxID=183260 RepID=A0ABR2T420_9ROSI
MNTNFISKPTSVRVIHVRPPLPSVPLLTTMMMVIDVGPPLPYVPPPDYDDGIPPGFGPAASQDEDDLLEFNF